MSAQQIAHEHLLRLRDGAMRLCNEHERRHNDRVLRERRIAATNAAVKADAVPASGFDLTDVGDEIFRRAEGINRRFRIAIRHDAPHVGVSAPKHACTINLIGEGDADSPHIKIAQAFDLNCSSSGTWGGVL